MYLEADESPGQRAHRVELLPRCREDVGHIPKRVWIQGLGLEALGVVAHSIMKMRAVRIHLSRKFAPYLRGKHSRVIGRNPFRLISFQGGQPHCYCIYKF